MNQLILFPIERVDPVEVETDTARVRRIQAYDAWQAAYLRDFYARRGRVILASGDLTRVNLYFEHLARHDKQRREAA